MADFSPALQGYLSGEQMATNRPTPVQQFLDQLNLQRQRQMQQQQMANEARYREGMLNVGQQRVESSLQHWQDMFQAAQDRNAAYLQDILSKRDTRAHAMDVKDKLLKLQQDKADIQNAYLKTKTDLYPTLVGSQVQANLGRAGQARAQTQKLESQTGVPTWAETLTYWKNRNQQIDQKNAANATTPGYQPVDHVSLDDAMFELQNTPGLRKQPTQPAVTTPAPEAAPPPTPSGPGNVPGATPAQQKDGNKYAFLIGTKTNKPDGAKLDDGTIVHVDATGKITGFDIPPGVQ